MNKELFKRIALEAGGSHYPDVGGKTLEKFAELIVHECVEAVKETDTRHGYTTFDHGQIVSTIEKSVESILRKFELTERHKLPHENRTMQ